MQLLSEASRASLDQMADVAPQAILLEGVGGYSARYEAEVFAEALCRAHGGTTRTLERPEDKTVIGISQVQTLYRDTRAKQTKGLNVWIIHEAQHLSEGAQDALLKLLEEPPASVVFILSVTRAGELLSTIQSRCRVVSAKPLEPAKATDYLSRQGVGGADAAQLLFLAAGSASELVCLAEDSAYREAGLSAASEAKTLISGTVFDRIIVSAGLSGSRPKALKTVELSIKMLLTISTRQSGQPEYVRRLQAYTRAHEQLLANGNIRLQLLRAIIEAG